MNQNTLECIKTKRSNRAYSYIRFSSPEQAKGNSLERQLKLSQDYAAKHGLELDKSLTLRDLGLSGFTAENIEFGALGKFLELVNAGKIARGSTLIVESFDRMGRTEITEQINVFMSLINRDITVVTLTDQKAYSKESINNNWTELIVSLSIMSRGHEESKTKSMRLRASRANTRKIGKFITSLCPAWLKSDKTKQTFTVIPERVALVLRIFKMADSGMGQGVIAKALNKEKIPAWGRSKAGWHDSYVNKILTSRSVLGEFQPHTKPKGEKRVAAGQPLENYYPAIISEDLFYRVSKKRKANAGKGGKIGPSVSNLFTGIAKCGYSGEPMLYQNKAHAKRQSEDWRYLVARNTINGQGGINKPWRYSQFETSFLSFVKGLDFSSLAPAAENDVIDSLQSAIDTSTAKIEEDEKKMKRLIKFIEDSDEPDQSIGERIAVLRQSIKAAKLALKYTEAEHGAQVNTRDSFKNNAVELKQLANNKDDIPTRFRLRNEIRDKIEKIDLFGVGALEGSPLYDQFGSSRFYVTHFKNGKKIAIEIGKQPRKSSKAAKLPPRFAHYVLLDEQGKPMDALELSNGKILDISEDARAKHKSKAVVGKS